MEIINELKKQEKIGIDPIIIQCSKCNKQFVVDDNDELDKKREEIICHYCKKVVGSYHNKDYNNFKIYEATIEITQFCEENCWYCSTDAYDTGAHLSYFTIEHFIETNGPFHILNISGGEPLAHPDFYKIHKLAEKNADIIYVYTNLLKNIKFNTDIIDEINIESNTVIYPGAKIPDTKNIKKMHLLKIVNQGKAMKQSKRNFKTEIVVSSNFKSNESCNCEECKHIVLQANNKIVKAPCKKLY